MNRTSGIIEVWFNKLSGLTHRCLQYDRTQHKITIGPGRMNFLINAVIKKLNIPGVTTRQALLFTLLACGWVKEPNPGPEGEEFWQKPAQA